MIAGSMILTDNEYLKYATIEWTQDVFSKSELIIKLYKDRVEFEENPELLAGVRVRIGDCIWENSARQKLRDFAKSLGA